MKTIFISFKIKYKVSICQVFLMLICLSLFIECTNNQKRKNIDSNKNVIGSDNDKKSPTEIISNKISLPSDSIVKPNILYPSSWENEPIKISGSYTSPLKFKGWVLEASEAHNSNSENGAIMGPSFAFWLFNNTEENKYVRKVVCFAFGDECVPMIGFEIVPQKGGKFIEFVKNGAHVIPIWPQNENKIPKQLAIKIEIEGQQNIIFLINGLRSMMNKQFDIRERWLHDTKYSGVSRIMHPRFYDINGSRIDAGSGSEIFLGPTIWVNCIFDLGHGENWYECRSLDENNPEIYFIIIPKTLGELLNIEIRKT